MKKSEILWLTDGWTLLQEADAEKHILEVSCFAENGTVTAIRVRHNDGEATKGNATINGKNALPLDLEAFKTLFEKGMILFR